MAEWPRIQKFCHQLSAQSSGPAVLDLGDLRVECRVADSDRWAVVLHELRIDWRVPAARTPTRHDFRRLVESWCATVDYLTEPLRVVEWEPGEWTALVRSARPAEWPDGRLSYYEIWWHGLSNPWQARLERKSVADDGPAQTVGMVWSRDVLARCIMDAHRLWRRLWSPAPAE